MLIMLAVAVILFPFHVGGTHHPCEKFLEKIVQFIPIIFFFENLLENVFS
jgi:hypothetical protein